jgi:hypothetical protein
VARQTIRTRGTPGHSDGLADLLAHDDAISSYIIEVLASGRWLVTAYRADAAGDLVGATSYHTIGSGGDVRPYSPMVDRTGGAA